MIVYIRHIKTNLWQIVLALIVVFGGIGFSGEVFAQSCSQMNRTIRNIERNRDFRNLNSNTQTLQNISRDVNTVERAFIQAGCQRALNAGQQLSRQCRTAARQITRARRDMNTLQARIQSGQSLAAQRAQLSQRVASGNCAAQSNNFFDQLFDALSGNNGGSQVVIQEEEPTRHYNTLRSVCVRKSDGYYWPVSFATVSNYLRNDAAVCASQCPGVDVDLYYYSNPGQEPKDMVNLSGQAYTALPNAFAYRNSYNVENSCKTQVDTGKIEIVENDGNSRTFLSIEDISLPLPLRDPRNITQTIVADVVHIPLPRPRPAPPGSIESATAAPSLSADLRVIEVNGRVVRIVGPNTPYARSVAIGT